MWFGILYLEDPWFLIAFDEELLRFENRAFAYTKDSHNNRNLISDQK